MENKTNVSCDNTECAHGKDGKMCTAANVKLRMTWVGSMQYWKLICKSFLQAEAKPKAPVYLGVPAVKETPAPKVAAAPVPAETATPPPAEPVAKLAIMKALVPHNLIKKKKVTKKKQRKKS